MLWQSGSFRENQDVAERVLDSMDLEREKGITILAKNTAVRLGQTKINIVDTPGHADFGGEVERGLTMVDGVLLLVDASEGPLPQTRFVLRKALDLKLPVVLVVNKVDRPDARPEEVVERGLRALPRPRRDESQIEFPIVYANARAGRAGFAPDELAPDLSPLFDTLLETVPAPSYDPGHPLQALVTNLDASPYVGRLALLRIRHGIAPQGRADRLVPRRRHDRDRAGDGALRHRGARPRPDRRGRAGRDRRARRAPRGDDRRDDRRPGRPAAASGDHGRRAEPVGHDRDQHEPARRHRGRAASPRARSRIGSTPSSSATSRCASSRRSRPDAWEVQGRGELQLAMLVELMRREGFELTVGKPEVLTKEVDGQALRAGRARRDRRPRGVRRRRHAAARAAQGPPAADGQPRHRLGADGVPRARPRADRLPHRVPHRDARHRHPPPRLRGVGAVARRAADAADGQPRRRPARPGDRVSRSQPAGARLALRRARATSSTRG